MFSLKHAVPRSCCRDTIFDFCAYSNSSPVFLFRLPSVCMACSLAGWLVWDSVFPIGALLSYITQQTFGAPALCQPHPTALTEMVQSP